MSSPYEKQLPSIRTRLWIGGRLFARDPSTFEYELHRFERVTRVSNLALRMDRPYIPAGAAMPNVRTRAEFNFAWSTINEDALLDHLDSLLAKGQPFGLSIWKQATDIYDGDGTTTTFLIQRRLVLPAVTPPTVQPDYPTVVKACSQPYGTYEDPTGIETLYAVSYKSSVAINAGDPGSGEAWIESTGHRVNNLWVSTLKVNPAPPAVADSLVAIYLPLFEVVPDEGRRAYTAGIVEPRAVRLQEFG